MIQSPDTLWVYLSAKPLFHLTMSALCFVSANWLYRISGRLPLLNPVFLSILAVIGILVATGTPYEVYFHGAQFAHFLLGPATVALAVPLYRQFETLKRYPLELLVSVGCGSLAAVGSAVGLAKCSGLGPSVLASMAPKSVTTPVAMGIAERIAGLPSLTAALVILTGIFGAVAGPGLLRLARVRDPVAKGLAMGVSSHGIGTARAVLMGEVEGAFSGLAIGLNGLLTAVLVPVVWRLFFAELT